MMWRPRPGPYSPVNPTRLDVVPRTDIEHIIVHCLVRAMLTAKQKELLLYIHERIKETGVSPSFDEMKEALDLASKSGIHRLITALEERGFLRRLPHRARALEVVKLPQQATTAAPPQGRQAFRPQVVEGDKPAAASGSLTSAAANDARELPVL